MWKFFKLSFLGFLINHSMAMGALGLPNGSPIQSAEVQAAEKGYSLVVGKILKSVDGISAGGKINLLERTSIKFLNISELKEKRKTEMINMRSMPSGKSHKTLFESCQTFRANYMVTIAPLMAQQTEPRNAQAVPVEVEICSRIQE
jgi:hypothetical protein